MNNSYQNVPRMQIGCADQVDGAHLYQRHAAGNEAALKACRDQGIPTSLVSDKPLNKPQPLLDEVGDRLSRAVASLTNGNGRLGETASRILGQIPESAASKGGATAGSDRPPSAADVLYTLLDRIEEEAERLHQLASRIERIG